jgi:hypothetical protein
MQRQRISNYNSLYLGDLKSTSSSKLRLKGYRDRVARASFLAPDKIYHFANFVNRAPTSFHEPVPVHRKPAHLNSMMHSRYQPGTSQYHQAIAAQITQLSRLV